jgi:CheY-like chemotaxis protein
MERLPILFVDDDAYCLQLIKRIVNEKGLPAFYAACGEDALEILRVNRCELMVTDLNMPGMDGYSLARLARKLFPDLRIILYTGNSSKEVLDLAAEAGISRVIGKSPMAREIRDILC